MLASSAFGFVAVLFAHIAAAAPAAPSLASNAAAPRTTPVAQAPPTPKYLPLDTITKLVTTSTSATSTNSTAVTARDLADLMLRRLDTDYVEGKLVRRESTNSLAERGTPLQLAIASTCLSSATDALLSSLFYHGGAGTTVYLCPNTVVKLTNAVFFTASGQTLATWGLPTGSTRAILRVTGAAQSCAIFGQISGASNLALRNVQVDGARPALGIIFGGLALIEMGGTNVGHIVDFVKAYEPRGWSALHAAEGSGLACNAMIITNNQIGPCGQAPSGADQFGSTAGQWADGISLACKGSYVASNTITDATDGGIVVFGAPGSYISGNTIVSKSRQLMGGVNMVDWAPFSGSFTGTQVIGNVLISQSSLIKVGIAVGGMVWGVDNRTVARTFGGVIKNNLFQSGPTGYFGYAIGVAGHQNVTVSGNNAVGANFGGVESAQCFTSLFPLPTPRSFVADQWTTPGSVFQKGFTLSTLVLLICRGPGSILARGGITR